MSIQELHEKIKGTAASFGRKDIYLALLSLVLATGSFALGRLSKTNFDGPGIVLEYRDSRLLPASAVFAPILTKTEPSGAVLDGSGVFVASVNGTKYYPTACPGANRIKPENATYFDSEAAAITAGYVRSSTCQGY